MKLNKYIYSIALLVFFLTGCSSIKETLQGNKNKSSDEFLVKKKNPLVLPPNFNELPTPEIIKDKDNVENKNIDLSSVLKKSKSEKKIIQEKKGSLEKSISNILNSN
jgi:PBP1b-binding outer membrane lipoprotein LpoB